MRRHPLNLLNSKMLLGFVLTLTVFTLLVIGSSITCAAQRPPFDQRVLNGQSPYGNAATGTDAVRFGAQTHNPGPAPIDAFPVNMNLAPIPRPQPLPANNNSITSAPRHVVAQHQRLQPEEAANPDAPDQSELLKNSKDPDFILHTFKTMWVDAHDAQYFGSDQMKAALGRNEEFRKLGIRIVDDPHVADVLLTVGYTFAWDYPFQLKHQNTTTVLVAGKGEGPFSGPLGAADVARQFVTSVKKWRGEKKAGSK